MTIVAGDVTSLGLKSQQVRDFISKHWKKEIAMSVESFYEWQFTGSPADKGDDHCAVAVDEESGRLVGVMGLNKRPFIINGETFKGVEPTTWIVDETQTGKGIGKKMIHFIQSQYDVFLGMGNGFRLLRTIPRFLKVFDLAQIKEYAQHDFLAEKLVEQWIDTGDNTPFKITKMTPDSIQKLEPLLHKQFNMFTRGFEYLDWRFTRHPVFQYEQAIIRGEGPGEGVYVCLRVEDSVENLKILHVVDCAGDARDMPAAISYIHNFCKSNGIQLADFYCTSSSMNRFFVNSGWFSIMDDQCFQFPHLFHPVLLRIPPTTSMIYWSKNNLVDLADIGRLYVTKQDADFDRPTLATYGKMNKP